MQKPFVSAMLNGHFEFVMYLYSRTVGKASSDMKLYFPIPEAYIDVNMERLLNKRASYFSGQSIYGNAIFANIGYTRKSSELFCEDVSLCSYYRSVLTY